MKTQNKMFDYYVPENILNDEKALSIYAEAMNMSEKYYCELWEYLYTKFRLGTDSVAIAAAQTYASAEQILPVAIREVDRRE